MCHFFPLKYLTLKKRKKIKYLTFILWLLISRLCIAIQEANVLRTGKTHLEKQIKELQAKCNESENEKYEAISRARDSMQLLEEANLKKNQVRKCADVFISNKILTCPNKKRIMSYQISAWKQNTTLPIIK